MANTFRDFFFKFKGPALFQKDLVKAINEEPDAFGFLTDDSSLYRDQTISIQPLPTAAAVAAAALLGPAPAAMPAPVTLDTQRIAHLDALGALEAHDIAMAAPGAVAALPTVRPGLATTVEEEGVTLATGIATQNKRKRLSRESATLTQQMKKRKISKPKPKKKKK